MGTYDNRGGGALHDPAFDCDGACDVCGHDSADCPCPVCPVCFDMWNPACRIGHMMTVPASDCAF